VHRIDIPSGLESAAPPGIEVAPWGGPTLIATRPFRSEKEKFDATLAALQGVQIGARPDFWQHYAEARAEVLKAARPATQLQARFPQRAAEIDAALKQAGRTAADTAYLPLIARKAEAWTVLLDGKTAAIVGYLPVDSF